MAEESRGKVLGMSFLCNKVRLAEAESSEGQVQINRVAYGQLDVAFDFSAIRGGSLTNKFSDFINARLAEGEFQARKTIVSLDNALVLVKKIPIDSDFSDEDITSQVGWEVEQMLLSPKEQFITAHQSLLSTSTAAEEVVIVAVRKTVIDYLRKIFAATDLRLVAVDINLFSAARALKASHNLEELENVGLIELGEVAINFSILRGGEYYLSQEVAYPIGRGEAGLPTGEPTAVGLSDRSRSRPDLGTGHAGEEDLPRFISKELRRLLVDNNLGETVEALDGVFLHGEMLEDQILESLQNAHDVRVDRANPFRRLRLNFDLAEDPFVKARPELFLTCVGAALKGTN